MSPPPALICYFLYTLCFITVLIPDVFTSLRRKEEIADQHDDGVVVTVEVGGVADAMAHLANADDVLDPEEAALRERERVLPLADVRIRGDEPLGDVVPAAEGDALHSGGGCGEVPQRECAQRGELPARREGEDGRPLVGGEDLARGEVEGVENGEEAVEVERGDALEDDRVLDDLALGALARGRGEREHRREDGGVALEEVAVHAVERALDLGHV